LKTHEHQFINSPFIGKLGTAKRKSWSFRGWGKFGACCAPRSAACAEQIQAARSGCGVTHFDLTEEQWHRDGSTLTGTPTPLPSFSVLLCLCETLLEALRRRPTSFWLREAFAQRSPNLDQTVIEVGLPAIADNWERPDRAACAKE
jgi:hypothetical protein